jgi:hypothetical protein
VSETIYVKNKNGQNEIFLYDADPYCMHKLDPYQYSGIKCLLCGGWFCF